VVAWRMMNARVETRTDRRRTDTRQAAREYLGLGWCPIPVPARLKNPGRENWQKERYTAADVGHAFDPAGSIGLLLGDPSGGLIDVDLDCAPAIAAAPYFLPSTSMVHGRASKRTSHYWFSITDAPSLRSTKYVEPSRRDAGGKQSTLVEVRGTGGQTIVPPSVHPSGELIEWEANGEPARVTAAVLKAAVAMVAACALVAWRWPTGARHDAALALAGLLLRGGVAQHDAERFVEVVARVAGDEDWCDRVRAVRDTYAETGPTTGGPRLATLVREGEMVVSKLREWLGLTRSAESTQARGKRSQTTRLVDLATEADVELFHDHEHEAFAVCKLHNAARATYRVRGRDFKLYLGKLYYECERTAANAEALQSAVSLCEAAARFDGEQHRVFTRVGEHGANIYLDLCDDAWRAVEITPQGWRIVGDPPLRFRRARGMLALPEPGRSGHLDELRNLINIGTHDDWLLVRGWLVAALRPRGPYPLLVVHGEQGSAKSTLCRLLRRVVDPNAAGLRAEPRDARDLIVAATNSWVIAF
jgi:hypothetical protein